MKTKKILSTLCAAVMVLGAAGVPAYANDGAAHSSAAKSVQPTKEEYEDQYENGNIYMSSYMPMVSIQDKLGAFELNFFCYDHYDFVIYKKTKDGSFKKVDTFHDKDAAGNPDSYGGCHSYYYKSKTAKLKYSTWYTFKIGAKHKVGNATKIVKTATIKLKTEPSAGKITKTVASNDSVKVTWKKNSAADGYRLYYRRAGSKYINEVRHVTVKGGNTTNYTVKDLEANTKYVFWVKPYDKVTTKYPQHTWCSKYTLWGEPGKAYATTK